MSPQKLSLTLALGVSIGIMPLMGVGTYLLALLAIAFRLNMAAIQIVNYAVYIIQIAFFVPFLKLGQYVFNGPKLPFDLSNIFERFQSQFLITFKAVWEINLMGLLIWLIIIIPIGIIIYYSGITFFSKQKLKLKA